jgi:hypothetical protein
MKTDVEALMRPAPITSGMRIPLNFENRGCRPGADGTEEFAGASKIPSGLKHTERTL